MVAVSRGRAWPASARDLVDYVKDMIGLPAPASFPAQFGGAVLWFMSRTGYEDHDAMSGDPIFKRSLQWA